jgi:phosphoribosyl-ATP pyrophosphohydrolase/phosphoribosyl-AMP cyclohydrolase
MPDFNKSGGLIPAIIQDNTTGRVLMLGYMNSESLQKTKDTGLVTFFSRSKERLWTKGEESGNFLNLVSLEEDCDSDTLLIKVNPSGPVCHTGSDTCWREENKPFRITGEADLLQDKSETDQHRGRKGDNPFYFLAELEAVIASRRDAPPESSYTSRLFNEGVKKIAQKVGEEAVELVLEAMDERDDLFLEESADLVYHLLVLINAKGYKLSDVVDLLKSRSR